ncbi:hypothetical protein EJB05_11468, partial [Eragrostis curvula]
MVSSTFVPGAIMSLAGVRRQQQFGRARADVQSLSLTARQCLWLPEWMFNVTVDSIHACWQQPRGSGCWSSSHTH